jgi:hypothetical protein
MKRYLLAPVTITGTGRRVPTLPAGTTAWVCVHDFPARNRMLLKVQVPDGTAKTAATIADITIDAEGRQVDVNAEALTQAQRDAFKTQLTNAGFDVTQFDGDNLTNRALLLRFLLRRLAAWQDLPTRDVLERWDAS